MLSRREFLGGFAVAAAGSFGVGNVRLLAPEPRDLVPGEVVRIPWSPAVDPARVRVVHRVDGRVTGAVPVAEGADWPLPCLEVRAVPPDRRLAPGRHDFALELDGRRLELGGFVVEPYRFGC